MKSSLIGLFCNALGYLVFPVLVLRFYFILFYFNCFLMQARPALMVCGQLVPTARKSIRTTYITIECIKLQSN